MQPLFVLERLIILVIIMRFSKAILLFFLLIGSFLIVAAQDGDVIGDVIKVDSSIVRLNVGVVDQKGRPITSLSRENFTIYEDGVKQNILRFEPTVAPFSVVMILDMSGSTLGFRETIRQSAFRFVDALAPEDRVAVVEFYDKVKLRNDFTTNRKTIGNSILVANGRGKTQLYKALDFALEKLSKEGKRRKAIIVLTDGVDTAVRDNDRDFLEKLKEAEVATALKPEQSDILNRVLNSSDAQGVTIYPLALPTGDPARLADPTPRQIAMFKASRKRLQLVAERTGGTMNKIERLDQMATLYAQVAADLRTLYTIEYQPLNVNRDGKWRTIKVELNRPDLISRSRQGYFAR